MRKLILLFVLALVIIPFASARSIDISIDKSEVSANSEIKVSYSISFDEVETFSYQVGIRGENQTIILVNDTLTDKSVSGVVNWNTKNYPAGEYEAFIFISPSTYWPSSKFKVLPYMDFNISAKKLDFFVYDKSLTKYITVNNLGNVPLFVSVSPKGIKSQASVLPLTSNVDVNSSTNFMISIEKPTNNYNATIDFEISWGNTTKNVAVPIEVYNPIVKILVENVTLKKAGESKIVEGVIYNKGNVYRNITFVISTSKGDTKYSKVVDANSSFNFSYAFPTDEKINSLTIKYIGSDGKEKTITKGFTPLSKLPKFDFGGNELYLLSGVIFLLLVIYLFLKLRKKEEKIDLEKLNRTLGGGNV
jgi:hypothetical protein